MKLNKLAALFGLVAGLGCVWTGCSEDINNYEKTTPAEATNKVFFNEKYAKVVYSAFRNTEGNVTNLDTLVAKLVVSCSEPAGSDLKIKVNVDTLLVSAYNKINETSYRQFTSSWIKVNRSSLTIPEGATESDTLVVALAQPLNSKGLASTDGYIVPICLTSASGYDAQVDYSKRVSYVALDVTQENGVGFEESSNGKMLTLTDSQAGCDLPLVSYVPSSKDIDIELEIDNGLVAEFNSTYGTDFKVAPEGAFSVSAVNLAAGTTASIGHVSFIGDASALDGENYLVPVKIKSVSEGGTAVKVLPTDTYYLVVNSANQYTLANATDLGTRQDERSGYLAISTIPNSAFTQGNWSGMFKSTFWVLAKKYTADVTIDLGKEMANITGICYQANSTSMFPKEFEISYASEALYRNYPTVSCFVGKVTYVKGQAATLYIKFDKPITARYIKINKLSAQKSYYTCQNFYIFVSE